MIDPVIFLDIDGVLNDHTQQESLYCGTKPECVSRFNRILDAVPAAKIVISSAWRYMILSGDVTLKGFEMLLLTHGVKCHERVIGHTMADGPIEDEPHHHDEPERWKANGLKWRKKQINHWIVDNGVQTYVVLDDLPLGMERHVQPFSCVGLNPANAGMAVHFLQVNSPAKRSTP